jgi:putative Holliday junction resolvase
MAQVKYVNALGIDVGAKRIGLARVNAVAKIPEPLGTFINDDTFPSTMTNLIAEHDIDVIVVGLPRNLQGQETPQTDIIRSFVDEVIMKNTNLSVVFQDETLTSVAAGQYGQDAITRFGLDSLAAVEILNDFIKVS